MAGSAEEALNKELYRIPGHAGWFNWNAIHSIERESLPEFFEGRTLSKTPKIYKEYRDFMINKYRENPRRVMTFSEVRKMLVGDVNCLLRVFEFLETWGLINFTGFHEADAVASGGIVTSSTPPGLYMTNKMFKPPYSTTAAANLGSRDITLQSKSSPTKTTGQGNADEWTSKETMLLLEAVSKFGENWDRIAQLVGKNRVECVKHFINLPFGDQFLSPEETPAAGAKCAENGSDVSKPAAKKQKVFAQDKSRAAAAPPEAQLLEEVGFTPLADASNPLLAQLAFMAAMAGPKVAAAAAQAALSVIAEEEPAASQLDFMSAPEASIPVKDEGNDCIEVGTTAEPNDSKASEEQPKQSAEAKKDEGGELSAAKVRVGIATALAAASVKAKLLADQEERDMELLAAEVIETQMKKLQSKLEHFEELEHLMEKERLQLEQMRDQVFLDRIELKRQQLADRRG